MEEFEKLITGIIFLVFGSVFSLYNKKYAKGIIESQKAFDKVFQVSKNYGLRAEVFVRAFFLLFGIIFLLGGVFQLYKFFVK